MLDFFFFPGSTYSYLAALRIGGLARAAGVTLRWRPFDVRAIMTEMDNRFLAGKPVKYRYMWRDIERRAARHGLPWNGPPQHPVDPEREALRLATLAAMEGWGEDFAAASFRAWFAEHRSPGIGDTSAHVLAGLGRDPAGTLARAAAPEVSARIEAETAAARRLGIFGAPSFAVGEEIFWGDDRLEEALDWARRPWLGTPIAPVP
ncbi:MAG: 2-hydroxychromene-2-carboxylate isomerase [Acetobacteraceae bacterium]|nr:2-hydroxychromene-2-carboxylate isomerase [Acetobacteraceae bacterium]